MGCTSYLQKPWPFDCNPFWTPYFTHLELVKKCSIFDNIFTFWEVAALGRKRKENLAMILLEFEETYDGVSWQVLKVVLQTFGFDARRIEGCFSLCTTARSRILLAGGAWQVFEISRSVRKSCPLTPFLFFLNAEALHKFLAASKVLWKISAKQQKR